MTDDLVKRLRYAGAHEAADEIERLQNVIKEQAEYASHQVAAEREIIVQKDREIKRLRGISETAMMHNSDVISRYTDQIERLQDERERLCGENEVLRASLEH